MPAITRPNAPNRLPSRDFGDLFLKSRVQFAPGLVATPSPRTTPANPFLHRRIHHSSESGDPSPTSPLASPSVKATLRRPAFLDRAESRSDSTIASDVAQPLPKDFRTEIQHTVYEEEPTLLISRQSSASSSKALKVLGYGETPRPKSPISIEPPREPRSGFKWKRDFLGGWLEIRVGRRKEGEAVPGPSAGSQSPSSVVPSPKHIPFSQTTTIVNSSARDELEAQESETPSSLDNVSIVGPLQEGLYCRTKRALGLKHGPVGISPYAKPRMIHSRTPTDALLERVGSALRVLPRDTFASIASTSSANLSIAEPRHRHHRGIWYSNSSSVRNLLIGRPPITTPEPEVMYTGSDSHQYMAVDLTKADAPAFLPSEARRIHTPPLPNLGHNGRGNRRGFFFDYDAQSERRPSQDPAMSSASSMEGPPSPGRDWYRARMDLIDDPTAETTRETTQVEVPDHLPSSPLCPRNPKHKSGGTGTCPLHGRNKSTPSDPEMTPIKGTKGNLSPVQETWWMN